MRRGPRENGPRSPGGGSSHARLFYPSITSVSPVSGVIGESFNIYGTNFMQVQDVVIDGVSASYSVISPTQIATALTGTQTGSSVHVRVTTAYNATTMLSGVWLSGSVPEVPSFTETITSYSPVIWYRMSEADTSTGVRDASGNDRHSTWQAGDDAGEVTYQQSVKMITEAGNVSMRGLNTLSAYFSWVGDQVIPVGGSFTVIWAFRPTSMNVNDNGFTFGNAQVKQTATGQLLYSWAGFNVTSSENTTVVDEFAMFAIVMRSGHSMRIYKNGVEISSLSIVGNTFDGVTVFTWNNLSRWDGYLDELVIFDSDIGSAAILEIYQAAVQ